MSEKQKKNKRRFAARVTVYNEIDQIGYIVQKWPNFRPQIGPRWSNRSLKNAFAQKWWKMCKNQWFFDFAWTTSVTEWLV